jgi:hypothetical protein
VTTVRIAEVGDEMLRVVRARAREKLVRAVREATELGTSPLREEISRLQDQLRDTDAHIEYLRHQLQHVERRNLSLAADRQAVDSSAAWALQNMPLAPTFPDKVALLDHALSQVGSAGMALEFGVYTGGTLRAIVEGFDAGPVFGFDSFEGLPEDWRTAFPAGTFSVDGVPSVPGADLVVGWFDETLPPFLQEHAGPVAFLHVDCDLYSSTVTTLDQVGPRLAAGSVILFDEYFNYPGWQGGEHRAWEEYVSRTGTTFTYLGYCVEDEQVAIRIE